MIAVEDTMAAPQPASRPAPSDERTAHVYNLGTTTFADVHQLQLRLQAQRGVGSGNDTLLLTEHRPVITLGRGHPEPNLRVAAEVVHGYGIDIVQTERGGDITYHGPGQLVAYGIIDLKAWALPVLEYVAGLESAVIGVLGDWGVHGERKERARGVWVDDRKIAAVGLNVRRSVTMHGIALNVDPDMSHFDLINPCGMAGVEVTSLSAEAAKHVAFGDVLDAFVFHFARVFDCTPELMEVPPRATA